MINKVKEKYKEIKKISQDLEIEKQNRYLKKNGIDLQIGDKFTFKKNGKTVTYKLKGLKFDYDSDKVYIKATKKDPILGIDIECTFKLETLKEITKNNKNSVESLFKKFSSMLKKIEL